MNKLTDMAVKKAKPKDTPYRLTDGDGMYLEVAPNGSKYWRMAYRFAGKQKTLALGVYPEISISDARERRAEARKQLKEKCDPGAVKQEQKRLGKVAAANSFEAVALEWQTMLTDKEETTRDKINSMLQNNIFPWIGGRPISEITPPELLEVLRRIEGRGANETAHRSRSICGRIYRYAISTGKAERDITADLRGALKPVKVKHRAAITDPVRVGQLLRDIDGYWGTFVVTCALQLSPLVFVRPGELRQAGWDEFDIEGAIWTVPGMREDREDGKRIPGMKMKEPHLIPLSRQAVSILRALYQLTGNGRFVFPSHRGNSRTMSENTINMALRALGYSKDDMSAHGFRTVASTILDNMGHDSKLIERQLAHAEPNEVKAAYKREMWRMYLPERSAMMQDWADYLDKLKAGADVIPIRA